MRNRIPGLLLCAVLFACSGASSERSRAVLRVQLGTEPISLDPALAEDGASLRVHGNTMEGLVGYDSSGKLVPRLASSWKISADRKTYRFEIRPDARWSDGRAVTASQFVFGIQRAMSPAMSSKLAALLKPLRQIREDHGQVVLELKNPTGYFLQALVLPVAYPAREDILVAGRWPMISPGTGPYFVKSVSPGQKITLEKNPFYYLPVSISQVEFDVIPDESTGVNLFDRGEIDLLTKIPTFDLPRLLKKGVTRTDPFLATYFVAFNTRRPPFSDREWRRAVAGSIRKSQITQVLATGERPARSWIPPGLEGFESYGSDAAEAERFARSVAHVRAKSRGVTVAGSFDSSTRNATVMEKIQSDLLAALGLHLSLSNLDWKSYIRSMQTDPTPIYRFGWLAPFADPISHLEAFTSGNPNNSSGWSNARYDELVRQLSAMEPGPAREKRVLEAEKILVEDEAVVVPIYHYVQNHAVSPRVEGFRVSPFGVIRFDDLKWRSSP